MELAEGETLEPIHHDPSTNAQATADRDESVRLLAKYMRLKKGVDKIDEPARETDELQDDLKQQILDVLENPAKAKDVNEGLRQQILEQSNILRRAEKTLTSQEFEDLEKGRAIPNPMYSRMYPEKNMKSIIKAARDEVVSPHDIDLDLLWDNPEEASRVRRPSEIIELMQKQMEMSPSGAQLDEPDPDWIPRRRTEAEVVDMHKRWEEALRMPMKEPAREPLFPKSKPRKEVAGSALQDSNELESLFASPRLRNSKTFTELIAQQREKQMNEDAKYRRANQVLGYGSANQSTAGATKHVLLGEMSAVQDRKPGLLSTPQSLS